MNSRKMLETEIAKQSRRGSISRRNSRAESWRGKSEKQLSIALWLDISKVWLEPANIALLKQYRVLKRGGKKR